MDPIEWRFIYFLEREREGGPDDDMHIYDLVYSKRDNTIDILFISYPIFFWPVRLQGGFQGSYGKQPVQQSVKRTLSAELDIQTWRAPHLLYYTFFFFFFEFDSSILEDWPLTLDSSSNMQISRGRKWYLSDREEP